MNESDKSEETIDKDPAEQEMPLMSHLLELRNRILRMVIAVFAIFFSLFYWATDLYYLLAKPLLSVIPNSSSMIATDVLANFFTMAVCVVRRVFRRVILRDTFKSNMGVYSTRSLQT